MSETEASRDHVLPKSMGGYNKATNYRLAHGRCNSARGSLPVLEVRKVIEALPPRAPMMRVVEALRAANKSWMEHSRVIFAEERRRR